VCQWSKPSTKIRAASNQHWRIVMQQDYYSTLANVVGISARHDPEKRRAIYALARSELRQLLDRRGVNAFVMTQEMRAFETAIAAIESDLSQASLTAGDYATNDLAVAPSSIEILPPDRPSYRSSGPQFQPAVTYVAHARSLPVSFVLLLIGTVILVTYLVAERGLLGDAISNAASTADDGSPISQPPSTELPMPRSYGVYALADGRLTELTALPLKVPERMTYIPGAIVSHSAVTKLANGKLQFIVFRADMVNNAPEKVSVRAVAKIARTTQDAGDGSNTPDAWSIAETSYQMKVAPVDGTPAMILVRPPVANFSFPLGRYVLVLKSTAYDFAVVEPVAE
jgi:hypothetical protein